MVVERRGDIANALRSRIARGVESGAIAPGDRLPSTREVASDLDADPRVVAEAYRQLEREGLVELRPRSGVFVSGTGTAPRREPSAPEWVIDALTAAVSQGVGLQQARAQLRTLAATDELRVVVAATMTDQVEGIARELEEDFGIPARAVILDAVSRIDRWPRALARADLVITTSAHAQRLKRFHRGEDRPLVIAGVRHDIIGPEWRLLASGICFVVVADPRFGTIVREFLRSAGAGDVRIRVAGRDRIDDIRDDAPTYITEAARGIIGRTRLPGRLIPRARILDEPSVRSIITFIVARNFAAAQASQSSRRSSTKSSSARKG